MKFEIIKKLRTENLVSKAAGYQVEHGRSILVSALVRCPCCEHEWVANKGGERGEFRPVGGGYLITCPQCPCEGTL